MLLPQIIPSQQQQQQQQIQSKSPAGQANSAGDVDVTNLPRYDLEKLAVDRNGESIAKGGVACPFPWRLHECLDAMEREGLQHIVSWKPHGRSFTVYQPKKFVELVMPRFFGQSKYASFQRQLNIYGFSRFAHGKDKGAYFHLCFVRSHRSLVRSMVRCKVKSKSTVLQPKPLVEDYDFYHPAWQNHFEPTVPEALRNVPSSKVYSSTTGQHKIIAPKVNVGVQQKQGLIPKPLAPSTLPLAIQSSSRKKMGSCALVTPDSTFSISSFPFHKPKITLCPSPAICESQANASVVSDDLSLSVPVEELNDFEFGMAFLEDFPQPQMFASPDSNPFEPTPIRDGALPQNNVVNSNLYAPLW